MHSLADLITPNSPERRAVGPLHQPDPGIFQEDALTLADALEARKPEPSAEVIRDRG